MAQSAVVIVVRDFGTLENWTDMKNFTLAKGHSCVAYAAFIDAPRLKRHEINHINDKRELVAKDENM